MNVIDPTKKNFTQPLSVKEILDELEISKDDLYRALSISKNEDLELNLKREPNSCFVNNCFEPLSVKEILDELEISKDDLCRVLSVSKNEDLELHLKRESKSCLLIIILMLV